MLNIYIITCPGLLRERLTKQINSFLHNELASITNHVHIDFEEMGADSICSMPVYDPSAWNRDISEGWPFFHSNLLRSRRTYSALTAIVDTSIHSLKTIFPPRELSRIEQEIMSRHLKAWLYASESASPTLILEDDIVIEKELSASDLDDVINIGIAENRFVDLCDSYIPLLFPDQIHRLSRCGAISYLKLERAITRTLSAYVLTSALAQELVRNFSAYALPADMHLQIMLKRLGAKGISIFSDTFNHGSKTGNFGSSTL